MSVTSYRKAGVEIADLIERPEVAELHARLIPASPEDVWAALHEVPASELRVSSALMRVRSAATRGSSGFSGPLLRALPLPLVHERDAAYVLAAGIGRPWSISGGSLTVEPTEIAAFRTTGWAKVATDFRLVPTADGTLLTTETRVATTDPISRAKFGAYWALIRPFSGVVRRDILRAVDRAATRRTRPRPRTPRPRRPSHPEVIDEPDGHATTEPRVSGLRIRPAVAADRAGVADLLRGLSAESAYRRFQTGLGPNPAAAILDALLPEHHEGGAVLAHVGRSLVGHGVWRRAGATTVAEIALVVTDAHQGKGIGTALAATLLEDLAARGVERVEVFTSASNRAVIGMVTRYAPDAARGHDGTTLTYQFPTPSITAVPGPDECDRERLAVGVRRRCLRSSCSQSTTYSLPERWWRGTSPSGTALVAGDVARHNTPAQRPAPSSDRTMLEDALAPPPPGHRSHPAAQRGTT